MVQSVWFTALTAGAFLVAMAWLVATTVWHGFELTVVASPDPGTTQVLVMLLTVPGKVEHPLMQTAPRGSLYSGTERSLSEASSVSMLAARSSGRTPQTLRRLLEEDGHHIDREDRLRCPNPSHADERPSCVIYDCDRGGHLHCFACGYHVDAFDYLVEHCGVGRREAIVRLDGSCSRSPHRARRPARDRPELVRECSVAGLPDHVVAAHLRRAERLDRVPLALAGRGFTVGELQRLKVAAEDDRAIIPITGPDGQVLRLKRRAGPSEAGPRYRYVDVHGRGTPAWCSPGWGAAGLALIVEGELNAAICWCVRPDLDVVGVAGTSGSLPLERLARRPVVLYTDGDEGGRQALDRWARALDLRGCSVSILPAWDRDACDVAGQLGRGDLQGRLA